MDTHTPSRSDEVNELLTILSNRHCRAVLAYFQDQPTETVSVGALERTLGAQPNLEPAHVGVHLHHHALPRLEDADMLEYDPAERVVHFDGCPELGDQLLESLHYESIGD